MFTHIKNGLVGGVVTAIIAFIIASIINGDPTSTKVLATTFCVFWLFFAGGVIGSATGPNLDKMSGHRTRFF